MCEDNQYCRPIILPPGTDDTDIMRQANALMTAYLGVRPHGGEPEAQRMFQAQLVEIAKGGVLNAAAVMSGLLSMTATLMDAWVREELRSVQKDQESGPGAERIAEAAMSMWRDWCGFYESRHDAVEYGD